jgi:hypothetical protein
MIYIPDLFLNDVNSVSLKKSKGIENCSNLSVARGISRR